MNTFEDNSQYDYTQGLGIVGECPCIDKMTRTELEQTYAALDNEYLDLCNDYEELHLDYLELAAECAQLRYELEVARRNAAL